MSYDDAQIEILCRTVHEALRAYCDASGQESFPAWEEADDWMRESTRGSILRCLDTPELTSEAMHQAWYEQRVADGWVYGETKDAERKTHPMLIPYADLSDFEKRKDTLVLKIVEALNGPV